MTKAKSMVAFDLQNNFAQRSVESSKFNKTLEQNLDYSLSAIGYATLGYST